MSRISRTFKKFPQTFWVANTIEVFERWAWYGIFNIPDNHHRVLVNVQPVILFPAGFYPSMD
jgi:hypothetical protein